MRAGSLRLTFANERRSDEPERQDSDRLNLCCPPVRWFRRKDTADGEEVITRQACRLIGLPAGGIGQYGLYLHELHWTTENPQKRHL